MSKRTRKPWLAIVVAGAVLAAVGLSMRPRPIVVEVAPVERGPLVVTLDEEGETRVRERFTIAAPLAGSLRRIELEPGDPVVAGETVVATLDPRAAALLDARESATARAEVRAEQAAVERAVAEAERGRAERDFARAQAERFRRLAAEAVVSAEQLETAELAARGAEEAERSLTQAVTVARHRLEMARIRLRAASGEAGAVQTVEIRAPIDGVVLRRWRESAMPVTMGEALLEVGDPAGLEIVGDFLSSEAVAIEPGMPVWIERWGGARRLRGTVRRIEPAGYTKVSALGVEEQRVDIVVDLEDPPATRPGLGDGYRVEIRVVVAQRDDVLHVPSGSLFRNREGAWTVFVVDGGRARAREVEVGADNGTRAEITGGLEEGQTVILHPGDGIGEGVRVRDAR